MATLTTYPNILHAWNGTTTHRTRPYEGRAYVGLVQAACGVLFDPASPDTGDEHVNCTECKALGA